MSETFRIAHTSSYLAVSEEVTPPLARTLSHPPPHLRYCGRPLCLAIAGYAKNAVRAAWALSVEVFSEANSFRRDYSWDADFEVRRQHIKEKLESVSPGGVACDCYFSTG